MVEIKFAPREVFEQILEWAVIPTFDLVIEYGNKVVIIAKRKIAPYQNQWALPGLRMYKGENIEDTLSRIASKEVGLVIDASSRIYLGQYVGKFTTEHERQDLSTGFYVKVEEKVPIVLNEEHFSAMKIISSRADIPKSGIGAMYKFYLNQYFDLMDKKH